MSGNRESVLAETAVVQDMAGRVFDNGSEPAYATEKLWRAFTAIVSALVHHLNLEPQELIDAIEKETDQ